MMKRIVEASPRFKARIAGVFYLLTILTGGFAAVSVRGRLVANLIATVCYIAVTLLFYDLFKPVNRGLSLLAAFFSFVGCAISALSPFHLVPSQINPLVFFGVYCLLIGYLIFRSTFLPRILGALTAFGGLGWLTFLSPPLANYLSPYNLAPGILGEGVLTLWLLVVGLNEQRWKEQASATRERRSSFPSSKFLSNAKTAGASPVVPQSIIPGPKSTCHSGRYVSMQPRFSKTMWRNEVKKMIDDFGAPIPEADQALIVEYLDAVKGVEAPAKPSAPPK